jgi:peptidoglycan-N-acetylglucosamine deacetylase
MTHQLRPICHALTIDYEDWYQGLRSLPPQSGERSYLPSCLDEATDWLLATLREFSTRATFFIVGQVARDRADLVQAIARGGHEIALHSHAHRRIDRMDRRAFEADLDDNIAAVSAACGIVPRAFRAPFFSIGRDTTPWFWEVLATRRVDRDSSVFPVRTPLYGMPGAPRMDYVVETSAGPVLEHPISTVAIGRTVLPFAGGFYFRALPFTATDRIVARKGARGERVNMYFHPWEFVPDHPKPDFVTARQLLTHYGGLRTTRWKLRRLLERHRFGPLGEGP